MECPLSYMKTGSEGIVYRLEGGRYFQKKVFSLGIALGKKVKVISSQPLGGPFVIEVNKIRFAIGRGMAMRIFVDVK